MLWNLGYSTHVCGAICLVVQWGVMFGSIISHIGNSGSPIVTKFIQQIQTADPVEVHVNGFGAFGNDDIVCDSSRGHFFCLEGRLWLGPTHFYESLVDGDHLLGGEEEGRKFRFGCRGHNEFDDLGES